ncbi:MAG: VWA domain-containing protein [Acidobacteria bacterium]|nr:VWA domain-containing protein [Acidobacteriota bacterium]
MSSIILALSLCVLAAPQQPTPTPAKAQQRPTLPSTPEAAQSDNKEVVTIREVRIPVTVIDKKGQPVTGLQAGDFLVLEDKKPQAFKFVSELRELEKLPIYVGVLMDTSASTSGKLKFEQEAALNFIYTVLRSRKDQVAFVTFDDEVNLRQDFTTNLDLLNRAVNGVRKPGAHTSLYDAVWQFCDEKMRGVGTGGRRVLVVITDGDDTYSRATLRDAIEIAQKTDTIVFGVSTKGGFAGSAVPGVEAGTVKDSGDTELGKLADETGGRSFFTGDILALERAFKKIGDSLRSQYLLAYTPDNSKFDGSYRRIEVKLSGKGDGLKIKAKRGYKADRDMVR